MKTFSFFLKSALLPTLFLCLLSTQSFAQKGERPGKPDKPSIDKPGKPDKPSIDKPGKPDKPSIDKPGKPDKPSVDKPGKPDKPSVDKPGKPDKLDKQTKELIKELRTSGPGCKPPKGN